MRTIVAISALLLTSGCAGGFGSWYGDGGKFYYDDLIAHNNLTSRNGEVVKNDDVVSITYDEREIFGPAPDVYAKRNPDGSIQITPHP